MDPLQKTRRVGLGRNQKVTPLLTRTPGSTCTDTPKAKPSQSILEIDSPDPLSRDDVPGLGQKSKGIGEGLRSEARRRVNRATKNSSPSVDVVVSMGVGRQRSVEPIGRGAKIKEGEKREDDLKSNGNGGGGDFGVAQRRSGRIKAGGREAFPVAGPETVKDKIKNRSITGKSRKGGYDKKGYYNIETEPDSSTSDGDDLGFKSTPTERPSSSQASKNTASLSTKVGAATLERTTRSTRSMRPATTQNYNDGDDDDDDDDDEVERGGKIGGLSKGRALAKNKESLETAFTKSSSTNGDTQYDNNSSSITGSSTNEPMVLDDLDCERAGSDFWREGEGVKNWATRKATTTKVTFKGKSVQRVEKKRLLGQGQKPSQSIRPGKKGAKEGIEEEEEEEAVIVENKWRDPYSYGNYIKPPQQQTEAIDIIPNVEFVNPIERYNIAQSPDHLENPKFTNGGTKTHNIGAEIINLTSPIPLKKRKTSACTKYLFDPDLSPLSSLSSSPEPSYDFDTSYFSPTGENPNICCICRESLSNSFLSAHPHSTRLHSNVQHQIDRCRLHKRFSAEEESKAKGYPATCIDWKSLSRRIDAHIPYLFEILEQKRHSAFRDAMGEDMKIVGGRSNNNSNSNSNSNNNSNSTGNSNNNNNSNNNKGITGNDKGKGRSKGKRKLIETDWQSHTPGYYGPRGAHVMLETIMRKMANQIRDVGTNDRLIAGGGVSAFAQSVLVPELGVHLVMEDLKVGEDEARAVMRETVEMGELLNDEDDEGEVPGYYFDDSGDDGQGSGQWVTV